MLNDTLRLELSPLGIEVLHVITGGISTKFYSNSAGQKVPENSMYAPIAADIEKGVSGHSSKNLQTMTPEVYARKVVSNMLSSRPTTTMWLGGQTMIGWLGNKFGTDAMKDLIVGYMLGMTSLGKKYRASRPSKTV